MMHLLMINPNTTSAMTDALVARATAICPPGVVVEGVTASFGPPVVSRRRDVLVAGTGVLTALASRSSKVDAAIIGAFADPGLEAAREVMSFPVVGLLESSLFTAAQLGSRIGLVYGARRMIPALEERLRAIGLRERVCGIRTPADGTRPTELGDVVRLFGHVIRDLVELDRAEVIILGGGGLIGLSSRFEALFPVPVIDSVDCAVLQACSLARLGARKAQDGSYGKPDGVPTIGLNPDLQRLFADDGALSRRA